MNEIDGPSLVAHIGTTGIGLGGLFLAYKARTDPMRERFHSAQFEHLKSVIPLLRRTIALSMDAQSLKSKPEDLKAFRQKHQGVVDELGDAVFLGFAFFPTKTAEALAAYASEVGGYLAPEGDASKANIIAINSRFGAFLNAARAELGMDKMNLELKKLLKAPPEATEGRRF